MEEHKVKILKVNNVTHDVKQFTVEKPDGYEFNPGQATEVAVNKEGFKDERRPFTFTSLNEDPNLEFTIKIYEDYNGVTDKIGDLKEGDELILHDVWGAINYKGPGTFLAGGAGVTPFISIFRDLYKKNKIDGNRLIFSNKTDKDIILKDEFEKMLGDNFYNTLTREETTNYDKRRIDGNFIKEKVDDFNQKFYICGPPKFVEDIKNILENFGADTDSVVIEE